MSTPLHISNTHSLSRVTADRVSEVLQSVCIDPVPWSLCAPLLLCCAVLWCVSPVALQTLVTRRVSTPLMWLCWVWWWGCCWGEDTSSRNAQQQQQQQQPPSSSSSSRRSPQSLRPLVRRFCRGNRSERGSSTPGGRQQATAEASASTWFRMSICTMCNPRLGFTQACWSAIP